ncbi:MAG: DUF3006 domain-containing protein [Acutalibacteraceae bacterium]
MKYSLDRIEGEFAVLIDDSENTVNVPVSLLPKEAKEGSVLVKTYDGYSVDTEETMRRKKRLFELQNSLFSKSE